MTGTPDAPDRHPADLVAERVMAVPSVVALGGGRVGQVATYLPGRRVAGVSWREDVCEVSVVLRLSDRPLPELAAEVHRAVEPVAEGRAVHVVISDVLAPDEEPPGAQDALPHRVGPAAVDTSTPRG